MSEKKKKTSLLGKVLGKGNKDEDGKKGKKQKGKLEKQPSLRESYHSDRPPTVRTATHGSDGAPLHYEEEMHYGAPVTAVHEDDPYSPYDDGGSVMRQPSTINVRPGSHFHHGGGGGYFDQPLNESPRGTVYSPAGEHEEPNVHVETAHPNVIALGEQEGMHMGHPEHVAVGGTSRQATVLAPGVSPEAPRMLKPGDQMEIDPRNPPTFVIDEGITLEIGDEENGYIPYEQYLANLSKQPPPKTGGTYIVQGGGDVIIQDENGVVVKTIPGTGAMAGRGPPQIHEPRHIIPILIPLSRAKNKLRKAKDEKPRPEQQRPKSELLKTGLISRLFSSRRFERPLSTMETQDLERWKEPEPTNSFAFPSLLNLVVNPASKSRVKKPTLNEANTPQEPRSSIFVRAAVPARAFSPVEDPVRNTVPEVQPSTTEKEEKLLEPTEHEDSLKLAEQEEKIDAPVKIEEEEIQPEVQQEIEPEAEKEVIQHEDTPLAVIEDMGMPRAPRRPVPSAPTEEPLSEEPTSAKASASPASDAPMASPNSFDDFDSIEDAEADTVLVKNQTESVRPATLGSPSTERIIIPYQPIQRCETPTPTDELSDLSEVILSPVLTKARNSQRLSQASSTTTERDRAVSIRSASDAVSKTSRRTLTHSAGPQDMTPPGTPVNHHIRQPSTPPSPPQPVVSNSRPALSRSNTVNTVIPSLPTPPANAVLRTTHRNPMVPNVSMSPPPYQEQATQPRLNGSPKIRAIIQTLEGNAKESEDYANTFVGSTRSLPFSSSASFISRRGSVSSVLGASRAELGSMWESHSSRSSTPEPTEEFAVVGHGQNDRGRRGSPRPEDNSEKQWELRPVEPRRRSNSPTLRPHFVQTIPGLDISLGLVKELRERRLRKAE